MPQRIQLQRVKGWRKPPGAVVVARPTKWGNPFRVVRERGNGWCLRGVPEQRGEWTNIGRLLAAAYAVSFYESWLTGWREFPSIDQEPPSTDEILALRGHDLACWCPLDVSCHAYVLLRLAN